MSDLNIKLVMTLLDRVSTPMKKIGGASDAVGKGFQKVAGFARTMADRVNAAKARLDALDTSIGQATKRALKFTTALSAVSGLVGGLSFVALVKGIIDISSEFEKFEATLETILGSRSKARSAMAWVQKFAQTTPYEVTEVTDAFVKLTSYGIDPQTRALRSLGDAASGMNKGLTQAVEALADAQTGEFERLKEFGIRSAVAGNLVKFTYTQAGKEIEVVAKKSATSIQNALLDIFDSRFKGAMERQSQTFAGMMSNLKDSWSGFQLAIGRAGFFDVIQKRLATLLAWFNDEKNASQVAAWAKRFSNTLIQLFEGIWRLMSSIDWPGLINGLASALEGMTNLVDALGGWKNVIDLGIAAFIASMIFGLNALAPAIAIVASAIFGLEVAAAPITLIILAIAGLAAGAYLLIRNWSTVKKWFSSFVDWISKAFMSLPLPLKFLALPFLIIKHWGAISGFFGGLFARLVKVWKGLPPWMQFLVNVPLAIITNWDKIGPAIARVWDTLKSVFKAGADAIWNILPDWMRSLLRGIAGAARVVTGGPDLTSGLGGPRQTLPAGGGKFGGKLDISIKSPVPTRVDKMKTTPGFDLDVGRGLQPSVF